MKTFYPSGKAIACLLIVLNSCVSSQNSVEQPKITIDTPKEEVSCFVQMNDGTIKNYATIKLVTGVFKTPHLLADGNVIINAADIKAYQDMQHYAVAQKEFTTAKPSRVAVEALPGFAVRVAKGKINVYSLKYYNGHNTTEKFFLQSGDEGKIAAYSPELMNEMLKDNTDAYVFFNENTKITAFSKKLLISVEIYNTSRFISKN
ncbi:hypothetical protein [Ferruginibacter sp.]|nr:hypothetical protein [Ferruginibacter sp.]